MIIFKFHSLLRFFGGLSIFKRIKRFSLSILYNIFLWAILAMRISMLSLLVDNWLILDEMTFACKALWFLIVPGLNSSGRFIIWFLSLSRLFLRIGHWLKKILKFLSHSLVHARFPNIPYNWIINVKSISVKSKFLFELSFLLLLNFDNKLMVIFIRHCYPTRIKVNK